MQNKQVKILNLSLLLFIIYGIGCLLLSFYYCVPNVEDFELSVAPQRIGVIDSVLNLLCFYDARFTTNLLQTFNVLTLNKPSWFFIMPLTALGFFSASLAFFLKAFIKFDKGKNLLSITLLLITSYYLIIPSLPVGLYYMSATYNYIYGFVFYFIWLGLLLRILQGKSRYFIVKALFLALSLVLSFGCSELFIVINGVSIFLLFVHSLWQKNYLNTKLIIPISILAICCLWFVVNTPSNKFATDSIFGSLDERYPYTPFWLYGLKEYGCLWLKSFINPITVVVIIILSILRRQHFFKVEGISRNLMISLIVGINIFSYLLSLVFYFGDASEMDTGIPHILNVSLLLALLANLILLPQVVSLNLKRLTRVLAIGLVCSFLFYPNNFKNIWKEWYKGNLSGLKESHLTFYKDVEQVKLNGKDPSIVEFKNYDNKVKTIVFENDLLPNRENEDWNIALELYFEVDEVRLEGDTKYKQK